MKWLTEMGRCAEPYLWLILAFAAVVVSVLIFVGPSSREKIQKYFPSVFIIAFFISTLIALGIFPMLPALIKESIDQIALVDHPAKICSTVMPIGVSILMVFFMLTFLWVVLGG